MYGYIRGTVVEIDSNYVILDNSGIGYLIYVPNPYSYKLNNEYIEGFVIEDINNFMIKTKTYYYDEWKHLRTKMESAMKTNKYKTKSYDKLEQKFINYLKEKYQDKEVDLNKIGINTERDEFLKKSNKC